MLVLQYPWKYSKHCWKLPHKKGMTDINDLIIYFICIQMLPLYLQ